MAARIFERPVLIQRKHFVEAIVGLDDALELLEGWPEHARDLAFETVHAACRRAHHGLFPLDAARENLRRFLARVGMLFDDEELPNIFPAT